MEDNTLGPYRALILLRNGCRMNRENTVGRYDGEAADDAVGRSTSSSAIAARSGLALTSARRIAAKILIGRGHGGRRQHRQWSQVLLGEFQGSRAPVR
jgi:hypothetical protein